VDIELHWHREECEKEDKRERKEMGHERRLEIGAALVPLFWGAPFHDLIHRFVYVQ
jgi:hypothetical protein